MPHVVADLDSGISPGRVLAAATDFSERRPRWWPDISPGFWQLHDRGPNWAEATEGSPSGWARERYEWPGNQVVGTTREPNVFRPGGTWTLTVKPRGDAGSRIGASFDRRWKGKGWLFSRRPVVNRRGHLLPAGPAPLGGEPVQRPLRHHHALPG